MDRKPSHKDLEHGALYIPLSYNPDSATASPADHRRPFWGLAGIILSMLLLSSFVVVLVLNYEPKAIENHPDSNSRSLSSSLEILLPPSRGPALGVSEKTFREFSGTGPENSWNNEMLDWQRTGFHFQPQSNWMNDPNGPLYYMGWYHFFYQYNPNSAVWGNITWGHAVSRDMIHWQHLPIAMVPDRPFDSNGVWTGSATLLPDGRIMMIYTGINDDNVQVQNLAYPANLSDPLLIDWVKYENNPVMVPPTGVAPDDFRDPTTAWLARDGTWRVAIGSRVNHTKGVILVYKTTNFTTYELINDGVINSNPDTIGAMHSVQDTGMWECVDFYPISMSDSNGLDTSFDGPGTKHVLKASLNLGEMLDYYAIGTYNQTTNKWTPDNSNMDVGIGWRVDYGKYYASKSFYDQNKQRRISWAWIAETDTEANDLAKGWASVQTIPRTIVFDKKTGTNILQWPVEEVETLRKDMTEFDAVQLGPGSVVPLNITSATQLDISATFEVDKESLEGTIEADSGYDCSTAGATVKGALGPFGLLVGADDLLSELTPVYFYISKDINGSYKTFFCVDETRSSKASDVSKKVHGSMVPVLNGEKLSIRSLIDHSIVESFAQGGRTVITSRIYPMGAINGAARVFLFNNATGVSVTASGKIWRMNSANIQPFPSDQM